MDIRALGTHTGLPVLLLGAAILMSACASKPVPAEPESQTQPTTEPAETTASATETAPASTQAIEIKADYPRHYTVKKGDTLWGIASKFLKDPWYWPEIWQRNQQVQNPHLIYPGDVLTLIYVGGYPQIQLSRAEEGEEVIRTETQDRTDAGLRVVKLTPGIRRSSRDQQIPTIPSDAINQFLTRPKVVSKEVIDEAPYIVASDEAHLILASDNRIYVRGELDKERVRYSIYRRGDELRDPQTNEILGYEIIYAGDARIDIYDEPATATIIRSTREILIGDFLMTTDKSAISHLYYPKIPEDEVNGQVVSLFDAISGVASYQIVVINRGAEHGMEVGHVLATYYRGGEARDKFLARKTIKRGEEDQLTVKLPNERSGLMMLFRVFDKVSYGLILDSSRVIRKLDVVQRPR